MNRDLITLRSDALVARIRRADGRLVHLSRTGRGKGLIAHSGVRYILYEGKERRGFYADDGSYDEWATDGVGAIRLVSVVEGDGCVTVRHESDHIEMAVEYSLAPKDSLLRVRAVVRGAGAAGDTRSLGTPHFIFAEGFNDQFEDTVDLYDDGAEVAHGVELPCWRVFFRKGHRDGLLLATRVKEQMGHFNIGTNGFAVEPHAQTNYSTAMQYNKGVLKGSSRKAYAAEFEIGPWTKAGHETLLRKAGLRKPVEVEHPIAKGTPRKGLKGKLFHAAAFASDSAASETYGRKKWHTVSVPWAQSGKALFATTGVRPPDVTLDPKLKGLYHVYVGIGSGEGVTMRATGDPETRIRICRKGARLGAVCAWQLRLSGRQTPDEVDFGVIRLDGRKLRLGRFPDTQRPCMIDYVRCVKLSERDAARWEREERADPMPPLSGLADCPDVSSLLDAQDPDPRTFAAVVWAHAQSKVNKIYWRIDGQCSDFPCSTNTMRYISAKVHGVFSPHSKAYGRALRKDDILKIAVDAGRKYGVDIWGWMRFNNYSGNVQSDFFRENPQFHEEAENGYPAAKLCLAHPEVRKHKIDILIEAAKYGLAGLNLGFLRHPPILLYAKVMRDAYRRKYGEEPARDMGHRDPHHSSSLPARENQEAFERWWRFRAGYLTTFARELKDALRASDLERVKVAIWVRPNHCLLDGIDLPIWLEEGLCDEVVSMHYGGSPNRDIYWGTPEWKRMVQDRVPLIRGITHGTLDGVIRGDVKRLVAEGYDGLCTYESNDTVLDTSYIRLFRSLRK